MHDRLRQSDLGVSEEIRRRVEWTLQIDPVTHELLTGIIHLAAGVQADLGAAWHSSQEVQEIFAAAVARRLAFYKPSPKGARALMQIAQDLGLGDLATKAISQMEQAPDALGAVIESADRRTHSYEHLQRLQAARRPPALRSYMRKPKEE
jgi:hypothetical protein